MKIFRLHITKVLTTLGLAFTVPILVSTPACSQSRMPHLERETIVSTPSGELAQKAYDAIVEAWPKKGSSEIMMKKLNQPWRAVYTSLDLMAEVENGGFHQFFWNSEGKVNAETEDGLQFLGAMPYHGLFAEARKIFEAHDYAAEKAATGNTWEGFTAAYKEKRMGELDTSFYKQPKRLDDFIGDFIKAHPELYTK